MEDPKKFYRHALSVSVDYWASDTCNASTMLSVAEKTKVVTVHHSLPYILSLDEENKISVWDYELKKLIWSRSVVQLLSEVSSVSSVSSISSKDSSNQYLNKPMISIRSQARNTGKVILTSSRAPATSMTANNSETSTIKNANQWGELREVDFADKFTIAYRGGCIGNHKSDTEIRLEHRLIFRFDTMIVLYNIFTMKFVLISAVDLIAKKLCSVAFLTSDTLAIGCHDGNIKLWNIEKKVIERVVAVGSKEVTYINTVPLER